MYKTVYTLAALTISLSVSHADRVDSITTSEGFVSGGGGAQTLTSYTTDSTGTFGNLIFASDKLGDDGNSNLWGVGIATDPSANRVAALTDERIDTGTLSTGNGAAAAADRFLFTEDLTNVLEFVIIFNGADDNFLSDVALYDASGAQLGSTVDLTGAVGGGDQFGTLDLQRSSGGDLNNRRLYGYSVNIADFGTVDTSLITGISFGAPAGADFNLVAAAIPEPNAYALLAGLSALGWIAIRRRK